MNQDVVVASRIRLSRNIKGYSFPWKMTEEEIAALTDELTVALKGYESVSGAVFHVAKLSGMNAIERMALCERSVINKGTLKRGKNASLILSEDEGTGIILNADDHIRIHISKSGSNIEGAYALAEQLDDFFNERYAYAFDSKYGYLTALPTNMGTAMKEYMVLHLPMLSQTSQFSAIVSEMGRFGLSMKSVYYGENRQNHGAMYVIFNQSTLGQSEESKLHLMKRISNQIIRKEQQIRKDSVDSHREDRTDQAYKAYGILKYSRILKLEDALDYLSIVRSGVYDGLIDMENKEALYSLMTSIMPNQLKVFYGKQKEPEGQEWAENRLRAEYIRKNLPEIK